MSRRVAGRALLLAAPLLLGGLAAACGDATDEPANSRSSVAVTGTPKFATLPPVTTASTSPTSAAPRSITIAAVGDISLARAVVPRMEADGADYPYALVVDQLRDADITVANLEGALTDRGDPWPKGYNFRTPPRFALGLRDAGIDLVSLANNHTMDYGAVGLYDTLAALHDAGVRQVGAGAAETARAPAIVEAAGLRVAFLACAATPAEGGGFAIAQWAAEPNAAGLSVCYEPSVGAAVRAARGAADFVVLVVHAGDEYRTQPNTTQRAIADVALAAGADAVLMHHAHVVQPVERRGNQLVAWGLGNFIFDLDDVDLANIPQPRVSLILRITLTEGAGATSFEAFPVVLDDAEDRPRPATPTEAAALQSLIAP